MNAKLKVVAMTRHGTTPALNSSLLRPRLRFFVTQMLFDGFFGSCVILAVTLKPASAFNIAELNLSCVPQQVFDDVFFPLNGGAVNDTLIVLGRHDGSGLDLRPMQTGTEHVPSFVYCGLQSPLLTKLLSLLFDDWVHASHGDPPAASVGGTQ